ncbi:AMIN domain-containing protein [Halomonas sp. E19]|uniref:AMIN domain-containing protein n=1 Tax=Halomonas sp. E19 TaxID=3397247 RepID=UPI004033E794
MRTRQGRKTMTHLLRIMTGICLLLASVQALANTALTALDFRQGQGGELQVDLTFSQGVLEVRGYRLDEPARLSIDLIDATNQLEQRRIDLGIGGVEQVTALEAGSRTRLVFHLDGPLPYDTVQQGNQLRITIGGSLGRCRSGEHRALCPACGAADKPDAADGDRYRLSPWRRRRRAGHPHLRPGRGRRAGARSGARPHRGGASRGGAS